MFIEAYRNQKKILKIYFQFHDYHGDRQWSAQNQQALNASTSSWDSWQSYMDHCLYTGSRNLGITYELSSHEQVE